MTPRNPQAARVHILDRLLRDLREHALILDSMQAGLDSDLGVEHGRDLHDARTILQLVQGLLTQQRARLQGHQVRSDPAARAAAEAAATDPRLTSQSLAHWRVDIPPAFPVRTDVHATRAGIVVQVRDGFSGVLKGSLGLPWAELLELIEGGAATT